MARRSGRGWWRSCRSQAKGPENVPRRSASRLTRLGTKAAAVPVHHSRHEAGDELLPALIGDRFGLGPALHWALGWSRLRRRRGSYRLGRNAVARECREDALARRLTGCADMFGRRSLRRRIDLKTIVRIGNRLRRWLRGCVFWLGGWLGSRRGLNALCGL